jgi:hypothetical protein
LTQKQKKITHPNPRRQQPNSPATALEIPRDSSGGYQYKMSNQPVPEVAPAPVLAIDRLFTTTMRGNNGSSRRHVMTHGELAYETLRTLTWEFLDRVQVEGRSSSNLVEHVEALNRHFGKFVRDTVNNSTAEDQSNLESVSESIYETTSNAPSTPKINSVASRISSVTSRISSVTSKIGSVASKFNSGTPKVNSVIEEEPEPDLAVKVAFTKLFLTVGFYTMQTQPDGPGTGTLDMEAGRRLILFVQEAFYKVNPIFPTPLLRPGQLCNNGSLGPEPTTILDYQPIYDLQYKLFTDLKYGIVLPEDKKELDDKWESDARQALKELTKRLTCPACEFMHHSPITTELKRLLQKEMLDCRSEDVAEDLVNDWNNRMGEIEDEYISETGAGPHGSAGFF